MDIKLTCQRIKNIEVSYRNDDMDIELEKVHIPVESFKPLARAIAEIDDRILIEILMERQR